VKDIFVAVEDGPETLPHWDVVNHNLGCLAEPEIAFILHVINLRQVRRET
jgi:hypothetical protein